MKSKKKKNKQDSTDEQVTQELKDRRNDEAMADWGIDYDELDPTQKQICCFTECRIDFIYFF